jgi:biopolymer transport protein ExbD
VPNEGPADLVLKMKATAEQNPQPEIHLRPNKASKYAVVANVLADTKRLGLNKIGVIGAEQFIE